MYLTNSRFGFQYENDELGTHGKIGLRSEKGGYLTNGRFGFQYENDGLWMNSRFGF